MPPEEDRAMAIGEDRMCSSEDMIVDRQTHDRHTHHSTPLSYRGQSNQSVDGLFLFAA